jgi:hypothetical protein
MRSVIYGALITAFLACAGTAQAANDLDGKALLCEPRKPVPHRFYGLVFDQGKVSRHEVDGYSKVIAYTKPYGLDGTRFATWSWYTCGGSCVLDRETLKRALLDPYTDQCAVSS